MLAIIISCIASFRQLFTKQEKARYVPPAADRHPMRQRLLSTLRTRFPLPSINPSTFKFSFAQKTQSDAMFSVSSKDCIVPLDNVYVSHGVGISSEAMEAGYGTGRKDAYGNAFQIHDTQPRTTQSPALR